ncbi:MAG: ribonuclease HII [Gemmatimonadetes bacterium]|nr:ribonuclease HII [Gemmatimonadota bacterium]
MLTGREREGEPGKSRAARAAARRRAERRRLKKLLAYEEEYWAQGLVHIAGVDEVGCGPLAGPVVAAAVILPPRIGIPGVADSKSLLPDARERLAGEIRRQAISIGLGAASAREIDRLNILRASHLAICRAVRRLRVAPQHVIVDGRPVPELDVGYTAMPYGDALVHSVACASIVAKVMRDRLMRQLARRYPGYGWEHNAGYATADHLDALRRLGPTPHHRLSFRQQLSFELGD